MSIPVARFSQCLGEEGIWPAGQHRKGSNAPFLYRIAGILRMFEVSLVGGAGFEPATPWMSTKYSNQLN
jgi:hypothetical protein